MQTDGEHMHDDRVTSVGFEVEGECDGRRLNAWLSTLMMEQGVDLFRSKGIIAIHRSPERYDCIVSRSPGRRCQNSHGYRSVVGAANVGDKPYPEDSLLVGHVNEP